MQTNLLPPSSEGSEQLLGSGGCCFTADRWICRTLAAQTLAAHSTLDDGAMGCGSSTQSTVVEPSAKPGSTSLPSPAPKAPVKSAPVLNASQTSAPAAVPMPAAVPAAVPAPAAEETETSPSRVEIQPTNKALGHLKQQDARPDSPLQRKFGAEERQFSSVGRRFSTEPQVQAASPLFTTERNLVLPRVGTE